MKRITKSIGILIALLLPLIFCVNIFDDDGEQNPITFNPPDADGAYNYKVSIDSILPSFMANVKELQIHTPVSDSIVTFPAIILEPGFFSVSTDLEDVSNRYASHGFIVVGVTNTAHFNLITTSLEPYKDALLETVRYLIESCRDSNSDLYGLIDSNAIGISGHSMGGGGTLMASNDVENAYNKHIKTAVCMNPFGKIIGENIRAPIFLFSSDLDAVINPFMLGVSSSPSDVFYSYESITQSTEKLFANFKDMDHNAVVDKNNFLATSGNASVFLPAMVSWFKVHLSQDADYQKYIDTTTAEFNKLKERYISKGRVPYYKYLK